MLSSANRPTFEKFRTRLKRLRRRGRCGADIDVAGTVLKSLASSPRHDAMRRSCVIRSGRSAGNASSDCSRSFASILAGGIPARRRRVLQGVSKSLECGAVRSLRDSNARVRRLAATGPTIHRSDSHAANFSWGGGGRARLAGEIVRPTPRECNPLAYLVDQIGRLLDLEVALELTDDLASELSPEQATAKESAMGLKLGTKRARSGMGPHATGPLPLLRTLRERTRLESLVVSKDCVAIAKIRDWRASAGSTTPPAASRRYQNHMDTAALAFAAQFVLAVVAAVVGSCAGTLTKTSATLIAGLALAAMLLFPLARVFPLENGVLPRPRRIVH